MELRRATVHGVELACREAGSGAPIVLLHGNPTSSYLWRRVIPELAQLGRVIAPDLAGMGDSGTAPSYRFVDHRRYLAGLLETLGVSQDVVLVGHDWGAALLFDWAAHHEQAVAGIAYTETIVRPRSWSEESPDGQRFFRSLRTPEGERRVLQDNAFIEEILPAAVAGLSPADLDVYRRPFLEPGESRRPMLTFAQQIPFDGEPADVTAAVQFSADWLATCQVPKLFVDADPGVILVGAAREFALTFPAQQVVTVPAHHFVPEDAPQQFAAALVDWVRRLRE